MYVEMALIRTIEIRNLFPLVVVRASPTEPTVNPEKVTVPADTPLVKRMFTEQSDAGAVIVNAALLLPYW